MKHMNMILIGILMVLTLTKPVYALEKESVATASLTMTVAETTKTADMRVLKLEKYLESKDSPFARDAEHFVKEADRLGLDWKLVAAIAGNESYFGQLIPFDSYNAWGWAVYTGMSYGANFSNWKEGVTIVSEGLKENYINEGNVTLADIGRKYAADPEWATKVAHFMNEIDEYTPADTDLFDIEV